MKLLKLIANLGYGSRKEVQRMFREGRIRDGAGELLYADDQLGVHAKHEEIRIDDRPLDPLAGLSLILHKPLGVTCSRKDTGRLVYDLLPPRYALRQPALSTVGRLDRETSGLLIFTDDGDLLHRIISPRAEVRKVYRATLAGSLRGAEAELFASGELQLKSDPMPLAPAQLVALGTHEVELTLVEGRYHQVRRMFAAVGNHVLSLQRVAIGSLDLTDLASGEWRALQSADIDAVFRPRSADPSGLTARNT